MINKISIDKVATYKEKVEILPKKINFFYGNNGSGKTTITKIIEKPEKYESSSVKWEFEESEILAYNKDFVRINFNNKTSIAGIYTLGEDSQEKVDAINKLKKELEEINVQNKMNEEKLTLKKEEQTKAKTNTVQTFWNKYKKSYCDDMKELYKGNISSMDAFFYKCLTLKEVDDTISFEDIKNEYNMLYSDNLEEKEQLVKLDINKFKSIIENEIFRIEIAENKEITLSRLIDDLNNSIWIKEGLQYLEKSHGKCPFCQNTITEDFIRQIQLLYDEKYQKQIQELNEKFNLFEQYYKDVRENIIEKNTQIFDSKFVLEFLDNMDNIKTEIEKKINNPRYICTFESIIDKLKEINDIIQKENKKIIEQNLKIKNISKSRNDLSKKAWEFIRKISNNDINEYNKLNEIYNNEIKQLEENKKVYKSKMEKLNNSIQEIENSISGISQTIGKINNTLKQFNFTNFSLKENEDHITYSIIRPNGEDASSTLSEGEFSFISFLYFYHLVFGSRKKAGLDTRHVLVIDDPVTSMDSNVLFIISTLIRHLIQLCVDGKRNIEQMFILSHNIYFFKEVTYGYKNKNKYNYFIVQKINGVSSIADKKNENPIKNSYELLWQSLRKRDYSDESNLNTMRRILEQYFHTIGNGNINNNNNDFISQFKEEDRIIVKSLLSYINDGSHSIMDGLYVSPDVNLNENAFRIFREIFEKLEHLSHYKMMMGETEND